ncbi:ADP-ribose pyrophosphatase [Microbacterium nanhaiense]|uniref:ADP-ribose pyrophosphatase n=1 Tax=Microbacterium nanhaiense TaxID=1301026 RepID=A0ABQ2N481_9MICO|nr:NUDIX hydrolase [Microbacterium nanhaiense]GGO67586.1 ADP-ribose pyrophosphatase [Microbacterium nanhaiense]
MSWSTKTSRTVYENSWIRVREDEVVRPDGSDGIFGVVDLQNEAVFVVALDEAGRVLLVHIERYTVGPSWEIVSGGTDGEDPLVAARRELLEETGLEADEWIEAGVMHALNGVCNARETVFIARGLREGADASAHRAEEGITASRWVPLEEALALSTTGELTDGESIAALAMAQAKLSSVQ